MTFGDQSANPVEPYDAPERRFAFRQQTRADLVPVKLR
jgi:hypothetical protein